MNYEHFKHNNKSIFLVDMTREQDYHFSELLQKGLQKSLRQGKRVAIICNKKGYDAGLLCHACGHIPKCSNCDVSISYHKVSDGSRIGLCHICKNQYPLHTSCPECHKDKIFPYGIGIQQAAEIIEDEYKVPVLQIDSSKVNSPNKINKIKKEVWQYQVIIWTSLLSQPITSSPLIKGDRGGFDLVIFLNADIGLNIPDFTAAQRNFHLLYDTFVSHPTQNFVVQTFNPEHPSIRFACKLDQAWFDVQDKEFRKVNNYPPFTQVCIILYRNEIERRLHNKVDAINKELLFLKEKYEMHDLEIFATPPLIYKMFGKYRYNIILKGTNLRQFMDIAYSKLNLQSRGFKVDRDAQSIV